MALLQQPQRLVLATAVTLLAFQAQPTFSKRDFPPSAMSGYGHFDLSTSRTANPTASVLVSGRDEVRNTTQFALLQLIYGLSGGPSLCCCENATSCRILEKDELKKKSRSVTDWSGGWVCPGNLRHYSEFQLTGLPSSCVPEVDAETMSRVRKLLNGTFRMFDGDKDGQLTKVEVFELLQKGQYEPDVKEFIASMETLSFDQYVEISVSGFLSKFQKMDSNGDGLISAKDYFKVAKPGDKNARAMIEGMIKVIAAEGKDPGSSLDYAQFVKLNCNLMEIAFIGMALALNLAAGKADEAMKFMRLSVVKTCQYSKVKWACDEVGSV